MSEKYRVVAVVSAVVIALGFGVAGCGNSSNGNANPTQPAAQITAIKNNSHMPPQAKAIAIGQIRAHSRAPLR